MNEKFKFLVIGLLLGGLIVWLMLKNPLPTKTSNQILEQSSRVISMNIDAHFIEQMIPHHEDAIEMAKLALQKAQHQEIKTLAENIISSQTAENEKMKDWYKQWFNKDLSVEEEIERSGMMGMRMGMMGGKSDIRKLETTADFDKSFIEEMIPHHQMAVMMAKMLRVGTTRTEMKQLAEDIINAQTKEIADMRNWYQDWGY